MRNMFILLSRLVLFRLCRNVILSDSEGSFFFSYRRDSSVTLLLQNDKTAIFRNCDTELFYLPQPQSQDGKEKKFLVLIVLTAIIFLFCVSYCACTFAQELSAASPQDLTSVSAGAGPVKIDVTSSVEEKITLDLKGVDINELFRMLSVKSGFTITTTPSVSGRITVLLNNLTFDDVLEVILSANNLACEKQGKVIKIMTAEEYLKAYGKKFDEKKKLKTIKLKYAKPTTIANVITSLKSDVGKIIVDEPSGTLMLIDSPPALELMESAINELDAPLETAVFDINYANNADVKTYLTDLITPGVGQIIMDTRSNKALVSDLPKRLEKIKQVMTELDEASRQVLIVGEILQVTLSNKTEQGIDWEALLNTKGWQDFNIAGKFPSIAESASIVGKLSVGTLTNDDYTMVVRMLQTYGDVDIISRPQVVVVNKEEAKIMVGSKEAYITQSQSQGQASTVTSESIEFIDVGIKLRVVPTIGKDGFVTMKIKPEVSSVRETMKTSGGSQIPIVETSETETVVKVKDGSMVMLAGLIRKEKREDSSGFPVLSKVPIVKYFFSSRTSEDKKTELVIFLTPKLISGESKKIASSEKAAEK